MACMWTGYHFIKAIRAKICSLTAMLCTEKGAPKPYWYSTLVY